MNTLLKDMDGKEINNAETLMLINVGTNSINYPALAGKTYCFYTLNEKIESDPIDPIYKVYVAGCDTYGEISEEEWKSLVNVMKAISKGEAVKDAKCSKINNQVINLGTAAKSINIKTSKINKFKEYQVNHLVEMIDNNETVLETPAMEVQETLEDNNTIETTMDNTPSEEIENKLSEAEENINENLKGDENMNIVDIESIKEEFKKLGERLDIIESKIDNLINGKAVAVDDANVVTEVAMTEPVTEVVEAPSVTEGNMFDAMPTVEDTKDLANAVSELNNAIDAVDNMFENVPTELVEATPTAEVVSTMETTPVSEFSVPEFNLDFSQIEDKLNEVAPQMNIEATPVVEPVQEVNVPTFETVTPVEENVETIPEITSTIPEVVAEDSLVNTQDVVTPTIEVAPVVEPALFNLDTNINENVVPTFNAVQEVPEMNIEATPVVEPVQEVAPTFDENQMTTSFIDTPTAEVVNEPISDISIVSATPLDNTTTFIEPTLDTGSVNETIMPEATMLDTNNVGETAFVDEMVQAPIQEVMQNYETPLENSIAVEATDPNGLDKMVNVSDTPVVTQDGYDIEKTAAASELRNFSGEPVVETQVVEEAPQYVPEMVEESVAEVPTPVVEQTVAPEENLISAFAMAPDTTAQTNEQSAFVSPMFNIEEAGPTRTLTQMQNVA